MAEILPYAIAEVSSVDSPYLPGMLRWLNRLFPEYTPQFETILTRLRRENGRHGAQIFLGLSDKVDYC